jgi:hypothetical protein
MRLLFHVSILMSCLHTRVRLGIIGYDATICAQQTELTRVSARCQPRLQPFPNAVGSAACSLLEALRFTRMTNGEHVFQLSEELRSLFVYFEGISIYLDAE